MNATVRLLQPPYSDLTYSLPESFPDSFWSVGQRVAVPLGRGPLRAGLITKLGVDAPSGIGLRPVFWPLDEEALLPKELLDLFDDVAARACVSKGAALSLLVPFVKNMDVRLRRANSKGKKGTTLSLESIRRLGTEAAAGLAAELCSHEARMIPPREDAARFEKCTLCVDPPWPVRPNAVRQREVLEYLSFHGPTNRRKIQQELEGSAPAVESLLGLGFIKINVESDEEKADSINEALAGPASDPIEPNQDQQNAIDGIGRALERGDGATELLFGVTGAGKTLVYLSAAKKALSMGKSVLLLAPEVAIAYKLRKDAEKALPDTDVVFYHGYQSASKRERCFRELAHERRPRLAIGTRSALFLPLFNLGLIMLDEEHDASFKQEEGLAYSAKEVAWFRASREKALLLLGSATPDIRTWQAAQNGSIRLLSLPRRVTGKELPPVELVDISLLKKLSPNSPCIAPACMQAMEETLSRNEQAIVLLNRRGFAPSVYCQDCRKSICCPNCAVALSFHRNENRLLCHYCGYSLPFPGPCPECGNMNFLPLGEGTERIADYLEACFARKVLRMDRDSTRRSGAMEETLRAFSAHEADILVGTQMLSKGQHFPEVTLCVVADADLGLNLPDYRAAERTFQLLLQSAGRAGRGEKPGRVLIQTRDLSHYCWRFIKEADYRGFFEEEIRRRQKYRYPPFSRLTLIRIGYDKGDADAEKAMNELSGKIPKLAKELGIVCFGPAPSPIPLIGGKRRFQCLVKGEGWTGARKLYLEILSIPAAKKLHVQYIPDPSYML